MSRMLRLRRDHQVWVAGHPMGIRMMSPDPTDPAARVGVGGDGGPYLFEVRPGDVIDVGDVVLTTLAVVIGEDAYVDFDIVREPAS
jgi:hypothetical protein